MADSITLPGEESEVQYRESHVLNVWGLLAVLALMSVIFFNDWSPLGLWIGSPRCENGLIDGHAQVDGNGQTHSHSYGVEPTDLIADLVWDYVTVTKNNTASYSGWFPPACD